MKKENKEPDPLGIRPAPTTGDLQPRFLDDALRDQSEAALAACLSTWVKHDQQEIVIAQIRAYLGAWALATDKESCGGRRLSQYSQAGKSSTMRRLRKVLARVRRDKGLKPNKYQVVIETLLTRIEEHSERLGLELLVIDEVQHLDNATRDATEVLDQLKTFVDEALFPIVFVGDEDSLGFFERNGKFAARIGDPLELRPMQPLSNPLDALAFRQFCDRFDKALFKHGAIGRPAGLSEAELLDGLILASGGHVGRVARILQVAVSHSAWRGADTVDAYDLSHAVRSYAIKNRWIAHDPYSLKQA